MTNLSPDDKLLAVRTKKKILLSEKGQPFRSCQLNGKQMTGLFVVSEALIKTQPIPSHTLQPLNALTLMRPI